MKPFKEYDLGATLSNQYAEIKKKIEKLSNVSTPSWVPHK